MPVNDKYLEYSDYLNDVGKLLALQINLFSEDEAGDIASVDSKKEIQELNKTWKEAESKKQNSDISFPCDEVFNHYKITKLMDKKILLFLAWQRFFSYMLNREINNPIELLYIFSSSGKNVYKCMGLYSPHDKTKKFYGLYDIFYDDVDASLCINVFNIHAAKIMGMDIDPITSMQTKEKKKISKKWKNVKIIVDSQKMEMLNKAKEYIENYQKVFETWNFKNTISYGDGMCMLLYGPPGTGKSLAAKYLSEKCDLGLVEVNYSELLSKYVGDTEKNINKIFESATESGDMILFDEADAMLVNRNHSTHNWEALQANFLLQKIKNHRGVILLITNREHVLDPALSRRIAIKIPFSVPNAKERAKIWECLIPKEAPSGKIDFKKLGEDFDIVGGYIKNAIVNAAMEAAANNKRITDVLLRKYALQEKRSSKFSHRDTIGLSDD